MEKPERKKFEELERKEATEQATLEETRVERSISEPRSRVRGWIADMQDGFRVRGLEKITENKEELIEKAWLDAVELNEKLTEAIKNTEQPIYDFVGFVSAFGNELTEAKLKLAKDELLKDARENPNDDFLRDKFILENLLRKKLEEPLNQLVEAIKNLYHEGYDNYVFFHKQIQNEIEKTIEGCNICHDLGVLDKKDRSGIEVMCKKHIRNPKIVEKVEQLRELLFPKDPSDKLHSLVNIISPNSEKNSSGQWDEKRITEYSDTAKNFMEELRKAVPYIKSDSL